MNLPGLPMLSAPKGPTERRHLLELNLAGVAAHSRTVGAKPVDILDPRQFVVLAMLRGSFVLSVWIWARSTLQTKVTLRQWKSQDTQMLIQESSSQLILLSASRYRRSQSPLMVSSTWPHSLPELKDSVLLDLLVALPSEVASQLCDMETAYAGTDRFRHKHGDGQFTDALCDFGFGVHRRHLSLEIRHGSDTLWSLKM